MKEENAEKRTVLLRPARAAAVFALAAIACGCGGSAPRFDSVAPAGADFVSTEIPLHFDHGMPCVSVETAEGIVDLYLDTGAAGVGMALLPETVESMGLRRTGGFRFLETLYGRFVYRRAVPPRARLGGLTFFNLQADETDSKGPRPFARRGLLGLALLREHAVLIDYASSRTVLYRAGAFTGASADSGWSILPGADFEEGLVVPGSLGGAGGPIRWYLDTGAVAWNPQKTE